MPRVQWSGTLSFGLVSVPVQVVSATQNHDVRFHQVHRTAKGEAERVQMKRVDPDGNEVAWDEIAKGWPLDDGRMLVLTQDELSAVAPEKTRTIDLEQFVPVDEIDPILFDHPYWLIPAGDGQGPVRAYRLLVEALKSAGEVGIGRVVLRNKEQLIALREREGLLSLTTMRFADEVRDPAKTGALPESKESEPTEQEIDDAAALIQQLSEPFTPEDYEDRHRQRLLELIEQKRKTGTVKVPEPEAEPAPQQDAADLMAALQSSLDRARRGSKAA